MVYFTHELKQPQALADFWGPMTQDVTWKPVCDEQINQKEVNVNQTFKDPTWATIIGKNIFPHLKLKAAILAWFLPVELTNTYPHSMYTS